jgi:hypothetical protein
LRRLPVVTERHLERSVFSKTQLDFRAGSQQGDVHSDNADRKYGFALLRLDREVRDSSAIELLDSASGALYLAGAMFETIRAQVDTAAEKTAQLRRFL